MNDGADNAASTTMAQLKQHYMLERELADRLRNATSTERIHLYAKIYDELFRLLPHHPQLATKTRGLALVGDGRQIPVPPDTVDIA